MRGEKVDEQKSYLRFELEMGGVECKKKSTLRLNCAFFFRKGQIKNGMYVCEKSPHM